MTYLLHYKCAESDNSDGKSKLSAGAIDRIVIGVMAVVGVVVFLLVFFLVIKSRKAADKGNYSEEQASN